MRYAFVSDIHGNLPAWKTVLSDIALRDIDRIICLGDTVGYGPQPAECLQSVYSHVHEMILGNHDAVVCGRMDPSVFNDRAQRVIAWTKAQLGEKAGALFSNLPLVLTGNGFRCTHGSFDDPARFNYVATEADAAASFRMCSEQLLFVGHSHRAGFFLTGESGAVYAVPPQDFALEDGKRYLVNVGSVGSPRDGDPRASYVIYDDVAQSVYFQRVTFDMDAFRAAVATAPGLNPDDVQLLRNAGEAQATVREEADFSPSAQTRAGGDVVEKQVSGKLLRENKRLKRTAVLAVLLSAVCIAAAVFAVFALRGNGASYPEREPDLIPASSTGYGDGNLLPEFGQASGDAFACRGYRLTVSDRKRQIPAFESNGAICISSEVEKIVSFDSALIECSSKDRIEAMARVKFGEDFKGVLKLVVLDIRANGGESVVLTREFSPANPVGVSMASLPESVRKWSAKDGWQFSRGTTEKSLADDVIGYKVRLSGSFTGTIHVGALSARRK